VRTARILVVTGASGAGKTATVQALEARAVPGVRCFYFDSIGVPTAEVMERDHGGQEHWQESATAEWIARLGRLPEDIRVAVLDGQTRPSFVFRAAARTASRTTHVVLLDCSREARAARLRGPRGQPELDDVRMDRWAAYLHGQADALDLPVIDTSALTVAEAADQLERIVLQLVEAEAEERPPY
jgi:signal recognition particle receptor subunit beta